MGISVHEHPSRKPHVQTLPNFLCTLSVAVAQFASGGIARRYVLLVLWMVSCFPIMGFVAAWCYFSSLSAVSRTS